MSAGRGILKAMPNTRFEYLYRDGSNYKQWREIVFRGDCDDRLRNRLVRALDSGDLMIAHQVRLPELFFTGPVYGDDHCWHEFHKIEPTDDPPDDALNRTFTEFVQEVEQAASDGWQVFDPSMPMFYPVTRPS